MSEITIETTGTKLKKDWQTTLQIDQGSSKLTVKMLKSTSSSDGNDSIVSSHKRWNEDSEEKNKAKKPKKNEKSLPKAPKSSKPKNTDKKKKNVKDQKDSNKSKETKDFASNAGGSKGSASNAGASKATATNAGASKATTSNAGASKATASNASASKVSAATNGTASKTRGAAQGKKVQNTQDVDCIGVGDGGYHASQMHAEKTLDNWFTKHHKNSFSHFLTTLNNEDAGVLHSLLVNRQDDNASLGQFSDVTDEGKKDENLKTPNADSKKSPKTVDWKGQKKSPRKPKVNGEKKTPKSPDVSAEKKTPELSGGKKNLQTPDSKGGKKTPQTPNSSGRQRICESPEDECHNRQPHVEICNNKNCPVNNKKGESYEAAMNSQKAKLKKKLFESSPEETPKKIGQKSPTT